MKAESSEVSPIKVNVNCQSISLTLLKELTKQQGTCGGDFTGQWGKKERKKERN